MHALCPSQSTAADEAEWRHSDNEQAAEGQRRSASQSAVIDCLPIPAPLDSSSDRQCRILLLQLSQQLLILLALSLPPPALSRFLLLARPCAAGRSRIGATAAFQRATHDLIRTSEKVVEELIGALSTGGKQQQQQ